VADDRFADGIKDALGEVAALAAGAAIQPLLGHEIDLCHRNR
jgi:hypothetical protein